MKAVVYKEPFTVAVEEVADPRIEDPNDVIIRVTTSAICGSDLHMYEGRTGATPGMVFGHENMGIVEEVGSGGGSSIRKVSDRVVPSRSTWRAGSARTPCEASRVLPHPSTPGFAGERVGYVAMGPYQGGQSEYLRVPFADFNCLKLPPGTEFEDDFALLADIFPPATTPQSWRR